jgi:hypothetical protein
LPPAGDNAVFLSIQNRRLFSACCWQEHCSVSLAVLCLKRYTAIG